MKQISRGKDTQRLVWYNAVPTRAFDCVIIVVAEASDRDKLAEAVQGTDPTASSSSAGLGGFI